MSFDILNRYTGAVLFSSAKADTIAEAVEEAVRVGASLDGASLDGASLVGASLVGASLDGASLDGASLDGANLDGAILVGAILVGASLVGASLVGATGLKHPILQIAGSRHRIVVMGRDEVCVGCHRQPMAEWLKRYLAIGCAEGYTEAQIAEYGEHLRYADRWLATIEAALPKEGILSHDPACSEARP